ncbi:unnamed protein product [Amoebophrya sp. A120]|nr:unnamed protein product [Amoebophrya sp. A120]|eukprot:GSA120T00020161001.1
MEDNIDFDDDIDALIEQDIRDQQSRHGPPAKRLRTDDEQLLEGTSEGLGGAAAASSSSSLVHVELKDSTNIVKEPKKIDYEQWKRPLVGSSMVTAASGGGTTTSSSSNAASSSSSNAAAGAPAGPSSTSSNGAAAAASSARPLLPITGASASSSSSAPPPPPPAAVDAYFATKPLTFMQVDLDDYQGRPHPVFLKDSPNPEVPILRMYGVTPEGHSVLAHIHGFCPYFYCPVQQVSGGTIPDAKVFQESLEAQLRQSRVAIGLNKNVLSVEIVQKTNVMEWSENGLRSYYKVHVGVQRLVQAARTAIETGFQLVGGGMYTGFGTFETNVPFVLRFLVDQGLGGGSWVSLAPCMYKLRTNPDERVGTCQIELDVFYKSVEPASDQNAFAPLRILSFDIECWNQFGKGFPEAERNPVIQIAAEVKCVGADGPAFAQVIWTLDSCGDIADTIVLSFTDERDLLVSFSKFVVAIDADFLTGYNILNFDLPYLLKRAAALDIPEFAELGRLAKVQSRIREWTTPNGRPQKEVKCDGRIIFDMYTVITKEHNLRSYTLNFVSSHFLGDQKEDVHYSMIGTLHTGTAETRRRLGVYCLKDAKLPLRLLEKLCCLYNYVEMARVTGTPLNFLLFRGQAIKVFGQILRRARESGYIAPARKVEQTGDQFEGATVLDPKTDFYDKPIATLDFASLYPSIMMAHNLCYCTLIPNSLIKPSTGKVENMSEDDYTVTPCGNYFVKPTKRKGLLPLILEDLLGARKRAKKEMNAEQDPFKKAVLNGRQLALKISANSVYGFTGAQVGMMPCLEISSSVTAFGRTMIEQTRDLVQQEFTIANGYKHDAEVIYGDTDSVMVKFGPDTVKESMDLGLKAADKISATFLKPIKLEFEKVYFPYLLLAKKRYAGLYWTNPDKYDKMDTKGIETVRRDNCGLVQRVVDTALKCLLIDRSKEKAIGFVQQSVSDLLQNKVDLALLVISKSLGRDEYAAKQAHVELAERMRQRNPATAPGAGDRVPYVIVKSMKKTANYEKSEDPMYVLENGLAIDAHWYIDHQLANPLLRIFDPIMPNASQKLFTGDHTRKIVQSAVQNTNQFGFGDGAKVTIAKKCLGCKTTLKPSTVAMVTQKEGSEQQDLALCKYCMKDKGPEIYFEKLTEVREKQIEFQRLWTECQRCQDSLHQEVICANSDCPIFYKRAKAKIDLQKVECQLKSLNLEW